MNEKAICPECNSTNTEYNDEYCAYIEYYCEDCGFHFKDYGDGEIKFKGGNENE